MKKIFLVIMIVFILFTSNFMAYQKAEASATVLDEQLGAIYVGLMLAVGAVATAGAHTTDWVRNHAEDFGETAKKTWDTMSTSAKQNFAESMNAAGERLTIAKDYITDLMTNFEIYKSIGFNSLTTEFPGFFTLKDGMQFKIQYLNGAYFSTPHLGIGLSYDSREKWAQLNFRTTQGANSNYGNKITYQTEKEVYDMNSLVYQVVQNKDLGKALALMSMFGIKVSIIGADGALVYGKDLPNYYPDIKNKIDEMIGNATGLTLGIPANSLANPYDNKGVKLGVGDTGYTYPDGTPYTDTVVWQPTPTTVIDVGGTPTAVIDTPQGLTDVVTGDVVVPDTTNIPTETDGTIGGFFSKLWEWLKSILQAILGLPAAIISALAGLLASLFVPSEGYWNNQMDNLKGLLWGDQADDMTDQIEGMKNVSSNQFKDVYVNLMGVSNLKIIDASVVNGVLSSVHSWVRGVFYALLVFFNTNQLYKLIRGTSLMESYRERRSGD